MRLGQELHAPHVLLRRGCGLPSSTRKYMWTNGEGILGKWEREEEGSGDGSCPGIQFISISISRLVVLYMCHCQVLIHYCNFESADRWTAIGCSGNSFLNQTLVCLVWVRAQDRHTQQALQLVARMQYFILLSSCILVRLNSLLIHSWPSSSNTRA